jgi:hypothetical protein
MCLGGEQDAHGYRAAVSAFRQSAGAVFTVRRYQILLVRARGERVSPITHVRESAVQTVRLSLHCFPGSGSRSVAVSCLPAGPPLELQRG